MFYDLYCLYMINGHSRDVDLTEHAANNNFSHYHINHEYMIHSCSVQFAQNIIYCSQKGEV